MATTTSESSTSTADPRDLRSIRPVILASFIGTTIEWYDFFLYGTAAALVFNRLFFPNVDPLIGTLSSFGTFAVGFVARPFGGIVFGHYGDRLGRKSMLVYSLVIMGVATFLIGLLPTHDAIGMWAPVLLVVLRCAQGIGVGGEWGGAVLMAVEHSPPGRRGLSGSWPQMGVPAGLFLSTVVFAITSTQMSEEQFLAWGWRLPFLVSLGLVAVGIFIRLAIMETPAFTSLTQSGKREERPVVTALRTHRRSLLLAMGMRVAENGLFYVYTVFVLSYGPAQLGLARNTMLTGVTLAALGGLFAIPLYGALSDRIGRRPVYLFGAAFSLLYALPFFLLLDTRSDRRRLDGHRRRRRRRPQRDVRTTGRLLLGTVRRERPLQRRVDGVSVRVRRVGRTRAVHRDRAAGVEREGGGRRIHDDPGGDYAGVDVSGRRNCTGEPICRPEGIAPDLKVGPTLSGSSALPW